MTLPPTPAPSGEIDRLLAELRDAAYEEGSHEGNAQCVERVDAALTALRTHTAALLADRERPSTVWVGWSGCVHEGGSTEGAFADEASALVWLEARRVDALAMQARSLAFAHEQYSPEEQEYMIQPEHYAVSEIAAHHRDDGRCWSFMSGPHDRTLVAEWPVQHLDAARVPHE